MDNDKVAMIRAHVAEGMKRVEEERRVRLAVGDCDTEDRTCLSYWYPRIAREVPTPRTCWIKLSHSHDLMALIDGEAPAMIGTLKAFIAEAAARLGYPAFLRTGHCSGKHQWNQCCFLDSPESIPQRIAGLVEWSALMDVPVGAWVVREMLDVEPLVRCEGYLGMPVVREWRYFVDGGRLLYGAPYWPRDAIEQGRPDRRDWESLMSRLHEEPPADVAAMAVKAGAAVGGKWSVDCLETKNGWFVTDMAEAERSYGWDAKLAAEKAR